MIPIPPFIAGLFSSSKTYIAIAIAVAAGMVFLYVSYLTNKVDSLSGQLVKQQIIVGEQEKTIVTLNGSIEEMKEINRHINEITRQAQEQERKLVDSLAKLEDAAVAKPSLVEKIINQASRDRLRCFELATGAEQEKNERNRVCPQLLKN